MGDGQNSASIDLIRWTFTINPAHRAEIEEYLNDLGLDVMVRDGTQFTVLWDEPEGNVEDVVENLWAIHEENLEITQEEFHCQNVYNYHHDEEGPAEQAA